MKEEDLLLIRQYLEDLLDEGAREAFEARLAEEPPLREELELARQMNAHLSRKAQKEATLARLHQLHRQEFTEPPAAQGPRRLLWLGGAAAAVAAVLLFLLWPSPKLYDQYAQHSPLSLNSKSAAGPVDLAALDQAFNQGQYAKALPSLNDLLQQNPNDSEVQLYRAICLIELEQNEAAAQALQALEKGNSLFQYQASWYLALLYIRQEKLELAMATLQKIPPSRQRLHAKAQTLMVELEQQINR
ncbi:MAG: tetratricopeptide repeat protein [Bacteroidota bacterium]